MTTAEGGYRFDAATSVRALDRPGGWAVDIDPDFSVGGRTNGGYLLAVAARAVTAEVDRAATREGARNGLRPVAVTGVFLAVAPAGPAEVSVDVLRTGRGTSVARATVRAASEPAERFAEVTVTLGELPSPSRAPRYDGVPPADLPDEAQCVRLPTQAPGFEVALMGQLCERLDPTCLGWAQGRPSGGGELRAWVRFDDDRPVDPLALLLVADCLPPATFDLGFAGWVPTLQLSVWLRAEPAPGPLRVRQVARVVDDGVAPGSRRGTVDETCDVWDAEGRLVATGHQLAGLLLPR